MNAPDLAARLPPIAELRSRCRAIALLDHIVSGGRGHYTYADGRMSLDSGSGDEWVVVFDQAGAFIRVFNHESDMSPYLDDDLKLWPGLVDGLPEQFRHLLAERGFTEEGRFIATAVLWRRHGDDRWHTGATVEIPDFADDGSAMLDILLDGTVERFTAFAADFYGRPVDRAAVEHVVAGRPITVELVRALNPDFDPATPDGMPGARRPSETPDPR